MSNSVRALDSSLVFEIESFKSEVSNFEDRQPGPLLNPWCPRDGLQIVFKTIFKLVCQSGSSSLKTL